MATDESERDLIEGVLGRASRGGRWGEVVTRAPAAPRRRGPTSPAPAQPRGAGGAGVDGAPRDWVRGARGTGHGSPSGTVVSSRPAVHRWRRSTVTAFPEGCPWTTVVLAREVQLKPRADESIGYGATAGSERAQQQDEAAAQHGCETAARRDGMAAADRQEREAGHDRTAPSPQLRPGRPPPTRSRHTGRSAQWPDAYGSRVRQPRTATGWKSPTGRCHFRGRTGDPDRSWSEVGLRETQTDFILSRW